MWCISEHRNQIWAPPNKSRALVSTNQIGPYRQTHRRGALASTKTDLGQSSRRGALVSTKQVGTLRADTDQRGALAFTETDLGPSIQTWCISEHKLGSSGQTQIIQIWILKTDLVHW